MNKATPKDLTCDIVVVGAGVSGVCAAVAAARNKAKVVLVEKKDYLGGVATACMHKAVCGIYGPCPEGEENVGAALNEGMTRELIQFLRISYNVSKPRRVGKVIVLPLPENSLAAFLTRLLEGEKNVRCLLKAEVTNAIDQDSRLRSLEVRQDEEDLSILPKVVIDCSGNGIVSRLAGMPLVEAEESAQQLWGYTAKIVGIQGGDTSLNIKVPYWAGMLAADEEAPEFLKYTTYLEGDTPETGYLKMNMPYSAKDLKEEYLTRMFHFIVEQVPEMKKARIEKTSAGLFSRNGAGLAGEYTLTEDDVLGASKFPDAVVKGAWPVEQWLPGQGTCYKYVKANDYYEIPARCLRSRLRKNLVAAGTCLSASPEALGSARVMGTCMSLGEAAGRLAADMI